MKRYVIERELPGVGKLNRQRLKETAVTSKRAENEAQVKEHAKLAGLPANKVTEVRSVIGPMTAISCSQAAASLEEIAKHSNRIRNIRSERR